MSLARIGWWFVLVVVSAVAVDPAAAAPSEFELRAGEKAFRLSEARGRYVALHFLLKTECPLCVKHVKEYDRRADEAAGVVHVFVKPDSEEEIRAFAARIEREGVTATIFRDPDARLAGEFEIPDGYAFHGETVRYPALVLLGPDGREAFRHVGKDNTDRMSFDRFADKLAELSRNDATRQYNLADSRLALQGYDAVSYFESGKPQRGSEEFTSRYRGVTYRFASRGNRRKFAEDPAKYTPAYGGWCATAMAEGRKVEVDPTNFKITDGRLLLFYKGWLGNALKDWNKDEKRLTARADAEWRKIAPKDAGGTNDPGGTKNPGGTGVSPVRN